MTARIHPWKLGLFVILALLTAVGTAFYVGYNRLQRGFVRRVTYFDESVQGLEIGAPVKMRGVTIGRVSDITIAADQRLVRVDSEVYVDLLDRIGLVEVAQEDNTEPLVVPEQIRVQLASTGITGVKFLLVDFFDSPPPPLELAFTPPIEYVPSIPSTLKSLEDGVNSVAQQLPQLLTRAEDLLATADAKLAELQLGPLAERMGEAFDGLSGVLNDGTQAGQPGLMSEMRSAVGDLRATLASADRVLQSLEGESGVLAQAVGALDGAGARVEQLAGNADQLVTRLDGLTGQAAEALSGADVPSTAGDLRDLSAQLGQLSAEAEATLSTVRAWVQQGGTLPAQATSTLRQLDGALAAFRRLADFLERQPGALLRGRVRETSAPNPNQR